MEHPAIRIRSPRASSLTPDSRAKASAWGKQLAIHARARKARESDPADPEIGLLAEDDDAMILVSPTANLLRSASGIFGVDISQQKIQRVLASPMDAPDLDVVPDPRLNASINNAKKMLLSPVLSLAQSIGHGLDGLGIIGPEPTRPTFNCEICFSNVDVALRARLSNCRNPGHRFCRQCLKGWLQSRINDGVTSIPCPMRSCEDTASIDCDVLTMEDDEDASGCDGIASEEEVCELCDPEFVAKYKKFQVLHGPKGDQYRECPRCGQLNRGGVLRNAVSFVYEAFKPVVRCRHCHHRFCFYHGDAHTPGSSCISYHIRVRRKEKKDDMDAALLLNRESRACPKCYSPTVKIGGCNHITCRECERRFGEPTHWCWICGDHFGGGAKGAELAAAHYASNGAQAGGDELPGCPGGQFADAETYTAQNKFRWLSKFVAWLTGGATFALWLWWTWRARWALCALFTIAVLGSWCYKDCGIFHAESMEHAVRSAGSIAGGGAAAAPASALPGADAHIQDRYRWGMAVGMLLVGVWAGFPLAVVMVLYLAFSIAWTAAAICVIVALSPLAAIWYWVLRYSGVYNGHARLDRSVDFLLGAEQSCRVIVFFPLRSNRFGIFISSTLASWLARAWRSCGFKGAAVAAAVHRDDDADSMAFPQNPKPL
uniref:RING-type domain-containing protein n=1 Tax=Phaeomonas parva TaxID=124430 RepID=A0A7S1TPH5_9STRA|mmetsp:Transcript_11821/g.35870  ORF Transcript_11821/g.35870 Transcript_11821/m.35870 type:complete len:658 (+) Transcript_11821:360-2333(+)